MQEDITHTYIKELKKSKPEVKLNRLLRYYRIYYNGHYKTETFQEYLDNLYEGFRDALLSLPVKLQSKENRHILLNCINNELYYIIGKLESYLADCIYKKYPHVQSLNDDAPFINRNGINYKNRVISEIKKLSYMVQQQIKLLQIAVTAIQEFARNDNLELQKANSFEFGERIKSNLNNAELSLYFKLVFQVAAIDGKFNKKALARVLANLFSTKEAEYPSENKIYNCFTNNNPQTNEKVKSLYIELVNKIRQTI